MSIEISQQSANADTSEDKDMELPSERTIGRWLREFRALDDRAKLAYRTYTWPEAMRRCALPWEASAALFDLGRFRPRARLTIRHAQCFWRVTLACPDAPIDQRDEIARVLAAADALPEDARQATYETAEAMIAYTPWRSPEHLEEYGHAIERGDVRRLAVRFTPETDIDDALDAIDELTGGAIGTPFARRALRSYFEDTAQYGSLAAAAAARQEAARTREPKPPKSAPPKKATSKRTSKKGSAQ